MAKRCGDVAMWRSEAAMWRSFAVAGIIIIIIIDHTCMQPLGYDGLVVAVLEVSDKFVQYVQSLSVTAAFRVSITATSEK